MVRVDPPRPGDDRMARIDDAYYRIENLGTEEGTNVGLVDEWIDRIAEPLNVNEATLDELMDLQNVSPADAVAIHNQVTRQGAIRGTRDLRSVPGLSDWGYRNARNYLGYEGRSVSRHVHGSYTFRAYNTPYFSDEELAIDPEELVDPKPDISHKLRLNYLSRYKAGILWHRSLGEATSYSSYSSDASLKIPEFKWFAGLDRFKFGPVDIDRAYVGSYQVSFGQGLSMESGDYFSPRYSGYGFDKRITGIAPDLSRAREFTLNGAAFEATWSDVKAVAFLSSQKKDAILNPDGSMNRLISLVPRVDDDIYPTRYKVENGDSVDIPAFEGKQSMLDAVREVGLGSEIAYRPWPGTSVGLLATQFMYDRPLKPQLGGEYLMAAKTRSGADTMVRVFPVIDPQETDEILSNPINSEILNGHNSTVRSDLWVNSESIRRIYGLHLMSVLNHYTWQFEYSELEQSGSYARMGDDPHAVVASMHAQWNSLTFLTLYRNYDIGYDNPYSRGFSNYSRYNGTTYEDEFYLYNAEYAQLERNSAGPQAERGVFLQTRYQMSRPMLVESEIDNWTRVADQADYYRWVGRITYRPVWPVMLRIRQKLQGRWNYDPAKETGFQTYENRILLEFRLSRFDNVQMLYANGYTRFTPRPRLGGEADPTGESPLDGQGASPTEALGFQLTHYFSSDLRVRGAWLLYDGFFWNFEDTDFTVLDDKSARWWIAVSDRVSDHLSFRVKITGDSSSPITWIQARDNNSYPTETRPDRSYAGDRANSEKLSFRIQLDYLF